MFKKMANIRKQTFESKCLFEIDLLFFPLAGVTFFPEESLRSVVCGLLS